MITPRQHRLVVQDALRFARRRIYAHRIIELYALDRWLRRMDISPEELRWYQQRFHLAPAFVQSASGSGDTVSSIATGSFTPTANNIIAVFVGWYNADQTLSSVTDGQSNTYATLLDNPTTYLNKRGAMTYAVASSGSAMTVTATMSAAEDVPQILVHEISGVNTTTPLDNNQHKMAGGEATGTDGTTTGNITTTQNGDYIFAACTGSAITFTQGTGYTSRVTLNGILGQQSRSEDQIQTSSGTIAGTFTPNAGGNWVVGVMAFQPAGGGATVTLSELERMTRGLDRGMNYGIS